MNLSELIAKTVVDLPTNPLGDRPNLILAFSQSGAATGQFDVVGNPIFANTNLTVQAICQEQKEGIEREEVGINRSLIYLTGRCFAPKVPLLKIGMRATATWKSPDQQDAIGEFIVTFSDPHWSSEIAQHLGARIGGALNLNAVG